MMSKAERLLRMAVDLQTVTIFFNRSRLEEPDDDKDSKS